MVRSLLLFVAVRLWWKYRKVEPQPADIRFLVAFSLLAPLLHIGLDFTNRLELGLVQSPDESFRLADDDTIASVTAAHREACARARAGSPTCRWTPS